jgi:putative SOS response-associated peptidase YedK
MALAGIWETYVAPDGSKIDTAAILTTTANGTMAAIHERMPVIVEQADVAAWLDCTDEDPEAALALVRPAGEAVLAIAPVDQERPRPIRARRTAPAQDTKPATPDERQGTLF